MNQFEHGAQVVLPNIVTGTATTLTFTGSFSVRRLRKMIRKCTHIKKREQLDYIVNNLTTRLVPVSTDQFLEGFANETFESDTD